MLVAIAAAVVGMMLVRGVPGWTGSGVCRAGQPFVIEHRVDLEVHVLAVYVTGSSHCAFMNEAKSFRYSA